jgi:hypothetical protein
MQTNEGIYMEISESSPSVSTLSNDSGYLEMNRHTLRSISQINEAKKQTTPEVVEYTKMENILNENQCMNL